MVPVWFGRCRRTSSGHLRDEPQQTTAGGKNNSAATRNGRMCFGEIVKIVKSGNASNASTAMNPKAPTSIAAMAVELTLFLRFLFLKKSPGPARKGKAKTNATRPTPHDNPVSQNQHECERHLSQGLGAGMICR